MNLHKNLRSTYHKSALRKVYLKSLSFQTDTVSRSKVQLSRRFDAIITHLFVGHFSQSGTIALREIVKRKAAAVYALEAQIAWFPIERPITFRAKSPSVVRFRFARASPEDTPRWPDNKVHKPVLEQEF